MTAAKNILVFGASGFVGRAVVQALEQEGHRVMTQPAPRLSAMDEEAAREFAVSAPVTQALSEQMSSVEAVVNAAGNPDASETDTDALIAANGALPGVLAAAARAAAGQPRFVHVSSAVVQGRAPRLDASPAAGGFSAYARSKVIGEQLVREHGGERCVVYRPPSVHAPDRRVTRMTGRIARSPLATVARPGSRPTPQALVANVASAVAFLATTPLSPPPVVIHPWEGLTTAGLMESLGGKQPRELPAWLCGAVTGSLRAAGRAVPRLAADARRVEMLWFGQQQADSWLTDAGWEGPAGPDAWRALGQQLWNRREQQPHSSEGSLP
jgi:dTDP-4-dehydrorhamnose reductase